MPTPGYICDTCEKFSTDIGIAEEHEKVPLLDPFPRGLVLKRELEGTGNYPYLIISSKERVAQEPDEYSDAQVHDRVYKTDDVVPIVGQEGSRVVRSRFYKSASGIQKEIQQQSLSELSEQELEEVKRLLINNEFSKVDYGEELEQLTNKIDPS